MIFGLLTKLRHPKSRGKGCRSAKIFCRQTTSYRCIISYNISSITYCLRNGHFSLRISKEKPPFQGVLPQKQRRKNGDMQKLVIWSSHYGGFYIGTSCFCDEKISALRHPLPLDFGGRSLVSRPKITIFWFEVGVLGVLRGTKYFRYSFLSYNYNLTR